MEHLDAAGDMLNINLVGLIAHQCEPVFHE